MTPDRRRQVGRRLLIAGVAIFVGTFATFYVLYSRRIGPWAWMRHARVIRYNVGAENPAVWWIRGLLLAGLLLALTGVVLRRRGRRTSP